MDITSLHAKNPKDLWKKVYDRIFPQEVVQSPPSDLNMHVCMNKDPCKSILYVYVHLTDSVFEEYQRAEGTKGSS